MATAELIEAARGGDRAALARLLSIIERGGDGAREVGRALHGWRSGAYAVGITGAPGAGKSTLTSALIDVVRGRDERIAVLAVDPSSPFTGGAILGDRVRMGDHALDDGVFIRSMATRGHLGGLAVAAPEAVRVLTAAGYPWVVLETVGVGQVEVEIVGQADTTVVVVNPGWGDAVQANKAGLMEIADVFVVNKADRPGAKDTARDLERMLDMAAVEGWRPPIVCAIATSGDGVDEVWQAIRDHRAHLESTGGLAERRHRRATEEVTRLVATRLMDRARSVTASSRAEELADAVAAGDLDPWSAADELLSSN
ncbi:MAG TPA: methylmalonyl Co-A mutase-associated GTPase MeaB [Acidimicrobiales bacterium]|nr:methylmalonyl Co-A mutase-associated GTPase MeaB [Acidimicrobiales bacterium]